MSDLYMAFLEFSSLALAGRHATQG